MTTRPDWEREIVDLHEFFQGWLRGELEPAAIGRLEAALADDFGMVLPSGRRLERRELVSGLRGQQGEVPSLAIRIEAPVLRAAGEGWRLAVYREHQRSEDGENARISTVLFREDPDGPNGLRWVHVHETWAEGAGGS